MIPHKKVYAMKMLQLALALSLLHVDPDVYLQRHLRGWDSQLELRDGDGWELEMLRAVPMVEYPYVNRKTMIPLIEDLVHYDRQHDIAPTRYNITAYLLNVQNDNANQTAALQELQTSSSSSTNPSSSAGASTGATTMLEQAITDASGVNASTLLGDNSSELDNLLFNADNYQDQRSIWEQNLADLNDFDDVSVMNPYGGLPFKDEPLDAIFSDISLDSFFNGVSDEEADLKNEAVVATNDTFPNPDGAADIKVEQLDDDNNDSSKENRTLTVAWDDVASTSAAAVGGIIKVENIKQEEEGANEEENDERGVAASMLQVDLSPFFNPVQLTKEESEIVEVLWKQDVDLGYSLTQPQLSNANNVNTSGSHPKAGLGYGSGRFDDDDDDDLQKLKALEELANDKSEFGELKGEPSDEDLIDEWAGIPFTIDNETGEYIRLPLDELLNDVLQLAEFVDSESNDDDRSVASTSKAAAAVPSVQSGNKKRENIYSNSSLNSYNISGGKNTNNKEKDNNKTSKSSGEVSNADDLPQSEIEVSSLPSPLFGFDDETTEELADLDIMLQSAGPPPPPFHHHSHPHAHHHHHHHHPHRPTAGVQNYAAAVGVGGGTNSAFHRQAATGFHHGHHQGRMPLSRGVSMEQRLQDIASLFNPIPSMGVVSGVSDMPPYPHYPTHHYSYQASAPQHGQYPPPPPHHHGHHAVLHPNAALGDICSSQPHYGHNLGSAVTSSMHLTNASHEGAEVGAGATNMSAYKMEHDMMYYSNASSDLNHTTDGFINSILNDEDLHLMDMNVNDSFCRMVDVNSTSNNSSVLGLSSGHASGGGSSAAGSAASALSMNGSGGGGGGGATPSAAGAAAGMSTELINSGAQGTNGGDRLDASSDSAVSSMGSERVPSLSDGEWGEGSDSAQDYHQGKYGGPYDYSYNNNTSSRLTDGIRQPPVAQKKHQMFGKRFLHDQPGMGSGVDGATGGAIGGTTATLANGLLQAPAQSIKYEYESYPSIGGLQQGGGGALGEGAIGTALSKDHHVYDLKYATNGSMGGAYSIDFSIRTPRNPHEVVHHNHSYTLPQGTGSMPRPQQRDKKLSTSSKSSKSSSLSAEEHLTRDEKRARALNIPIAVVDIINLPMDEFNERLSKYDLTENQLSLIRDIRRRGKNKVAAQNCRKRKLDQILSLEDEVKEVRRRKDQLISDRESLLTERKRAANKFAALHRHIFQYLRDADGNPCSPNEYSLQQAANGSIYLLKRDGGTKSEGASGTPLTPLANNNNNSDASNSTFSHAAVTTHQHHPHGHITAAPPLTAQSHPHHPQIHAHQQQQQHTISQAHGLHSTQQQQQQQQTQQQPQHVNSLHHQTHQKD